MSGLPKIEIVSAGAGSGKTFRIKETVGKWVKDGLVKPEKIVAVTFTEAAAAELRERLRAELADVGMVEEALRLDQAYISTIHGFGLRLITEFAFEAGLPPKSRLLEDDEENALIRHAVARSGDVSQITQNLARYGYKWVFGYNRSAEDYFRAHVREFLERFRSVGQAKEAGVYSNFARGFLGSRYGETIDGDTAYQSLRDAVGALLNAFPNDFSAEYQGNKSAIKGFRENYKSLTRAKDPKILERDWALWQKLRNLRVGNSRTLAPDGYDSLAQAVTSAADALPNHPGPLEDAQAQAELLINASIEAIIDYRAAKRKFALVDYTDMIALACTLLGNNETVLETLRDRVDCLVIDEFQDTNPLQFALLWLLKKAGVPTLVVGDLKQAIMGFQGADPRLMGALLEDHIATQNELPNNWRSQPSLMPFINAIGEGLFPGKYGYLNPMAKSGFQEPLEIIFHPKPAKGGSKASVRALWIADRVAELLKDDTQFIRDRKTEKKRRLRGGDIAILCPRHKQLVRYADALRELGIKVRIQEAGWYQSRIVEITLHALEYATDPSDRHAALYMSTTEFGHLSLEEACRSLIKENVIGDAILEGLAGLRLFESSMTVDRQLSLLISHLGLYERIARWPDGRQVRADLLRLQGEAKKFVDAKPETLASGGLYGSTSRTFLAWLKRKIQLGKDENRRPAAEAEDADAVQLVTWHASKGREWPIVALCGMEDKIDARLPDLSVHYENFDDLETVLENARLTFVPEFAAPETRNLFISQLLDEQIETSKRLLYVALTRARERLIMEWNQHLASSKTFSLHALFRTTLEASVGDAEMKLGEQSFKCRVTKNDGEMPDYKKHRLEKSNQMIVGRSLLKTRPESASTEIFATPSSRDAVSKPPRPEVLQAGPPLALPGARSGAEYGTLIHKAFEILLHRPEALSSLNKLLGVDWSADELAALEASATGLRDWVEATWSPRSMVSECPFIAKDNAGIVVTGIIDLLVSTEEGCWIVDHKTDQGRSAEELFAQYWPQLEGYAEAIRNSGSDVLGVALHHVPTGKMILSNA